MPKETVEWVTPPETLNRKGSAFATYERVPALNVAYGDVCLVVRIGKAGERLAYPRVWNAHDDDAQAISGLESNSNLPPADVRCRTHIYGSEVEYY